ncbi:hypothetical protein DdX_16136 [Ditylenchus destructor]|uniref:Uncharacterized protein n=1 Tax=Ditylenchus destructor TaxID=166010 RepID=A0AAD4MTM9_9BILA|nr:hypothetical protein DdX_16136 [Ditylenchus destructor]
MLYFRWIFLLLLFDTGLLQESPQSVLQENSTEPALEPTTNQTEEDPLDPFDKSTTDAPQETTQAECENGIDDMVKKCKGTHANWDNPVKQCDEMLKERECTSEVICSRCSEDNELEYMITYYKPRVFACRYCKVLVDYMKKLRYNDDNHGNVVQVDLKENQIGNLTCDLDWEAEGDVCIQKNAANLTMNCPSFSPGFLENDTRSNKLYCNEQFEHEKCMGQSIDAMCGNETEKAYWQQRIETSNLTIYACKYCNKLVDYLYNRYNLKVPQADESHDSLRQPSEKLEYAKTCPVLANETANCVIENAAPLIHRCKDKLEVHSHKHEEYCRKMLEVLVCTNNHLDAICGSNIAEYNVKEKRFAVKLEYCPYCTDAIDYLEKNGTFLYKKENETILDSFCQKEDCNISVLEKGINGTCRYASNGTLQDNCNKMYEEAKCAHDYVERQCGSVFAKEKYMYSYYPGMFAKQYMNGRIPRPAVYTCAFCMELVTFLDKFNVKVQQLRRNGSPVNSYCPVSQNSDCVKEHAKWATETDGECRWRGNNTVGQDFCSSMFEHLNCTHKEIEAICGPKVSQQYMQSYTPTALSNDCQYCYKAIDVMERLGGHLYKKDFKGAFCIKAECETGELKKRVDSQCTFKAQTTHQDTCKELLRVAKCAYGYVTNTCSEYRAINYTRDELIIAAYPCIYCQEVIDYMDKYGGKVYQAYKNGTQIGKMTCPLSYNSSECATKHAKPLIDVELSAFASIQFKRADDYCKDFRPTLESIYTQAEAVCGETIANEYMKTSTHKVKSDACKYCKEAVNYMQRFGGHLYTDETGNPICSPDGEDDQNSAAEFVHMFNYAFLIFLAFYSEKIFNVYL